MPSNNYQIAAMPGAIVDLFEETNDTIYQSVSTKALSDYGTIMLNLQNIESYPIIVQLTDTKGTVLDEKYSEQKETLNFQYISPGNVLLRVIFDTNKNRKWDTGNYLKKIQPEKIKYFRDTLEVRANFDYPENLSLD